ncbi:MAG TPA: hypothetical protein VFT06_03970, partial [Flavisolibacter sp.]|nr:hypothetical protein [Flavisolibacter sp.]
SNQERQIALKSRPAGQQSLYGNKRVKAKNDRRFQLVQKQANIRKLTRLFTKLISFLEIFFVPKNDNSLLIINILQPYIFFGETVFVKI